MDSIEMRVMLDQELWHNHPLMRLRLSQAGQLKAFKKGRVLEAKALQKELMRGVDRRDLNTVWMVNEIVRHQLLDLPDLDEI